MERKSISIKADTYMALSEWKSPGQSFEGAIQELLQKINETNEIEATA